MSIIALIGKVVAWLKTIVQWWTNHKRLRQESYDRLFPVYKAIDEYLWSVLTLGGVDDNAETKFLNETKNVSFLFGKDIKVFVDQIFKNSTELRALQRVQNSLSGKSLDENLNKQQLMKDWFKREADSLQCRFKKYLSLC
jgi:DNA-binding ferritin-like protein (Dps family)